MLNIATADALRLLGDESRLKLFEALKAGPRYPGDLARHLKVTPAAVSQHLRVLKGVGLLRADRQGTRIRYALKHEVLRQLAKVFGRICACECDCCGKG